MKSKSTTKKSSKREGKGYQPTAREIRRACASIRENWSDRERRKRAGVPKEEPWTPPQTRIDFSDEEDNAAAW
jgi:hypothetical protein